MYSKFKVFLLTGCFLLIATAVFAEPFWYFHTGHQIKYTRAKADGTNWLVTMTIGAGGQNQCLRGDYYQVTETDYDGPGTGDKTMYLRVTENEGYQCEGGTTEIKFFQTGPEGTGWSYGTDTDGVRFQVVAATNFGARYVIRRYEIQGGVNKPAVFNTFMRGFGLMKETDNWVSDNAPWTQWRHGYGGRTLCAIFEGYGLYVYDYDGKGTWTQINTLAPTNMVVAGPNLYVTFEGYGLYVWDGTTWTQINTLVPTKMVASGSILYVVFTGYGLYKYDGSTWTQINTLVPGSMVVSNNYLYVTFTGYGLYKYDGSTWTQINTLVPTNIVGQ